jgi:hypothetical protein
MPTTSPQSSYTSKSSGLKVSLTEASDGLSAANQTENDCGWYEIVSGDSLEQGDVLPGIRTERVVTDPGAAGGYRIRVGIGDYIVLSQTCDLEHEKVQEVLLANFRNYQDLARESNSARRSAFRDALIQGAEFAYFLMHRFEGPPALDWSIVNFHQLRLIDIVSCRAQAEVLGPRLRLTPPYKENLAQSFGRYMMRVALPQTAHSFKNVRYTGPVN